MVHLVPGLLDQLLALRALEPLFLEAEFPFLLYRFQGCDKDYR